MVLWFQDLPYGYCGLKIEILGLQTNLFFVAFCVAPIYVQRFSYSILSFITLHIWNLNF